MKHVHVTQKAEEIRQLNDKKKTIKRIASYHHYHATNKMITVICNK